MEITVINQQLGRVVDLDAVRSAVRAVLDDSPFRSGSVSIAVVDDPTIHDLNRQFLDHDWPTDVLSFTLEQSGTQLEGEVIVSADTAFKQAPEFGWTASEELLLYVIHGTLHLVGYHDKLPADAEAMRAAEDRFLEQMGIRRAPGPVPKLEEQGRREH